MINLEHQVIMRYMTFRRSDFLFLLGLVPYTEVLVFVVKLTVTEETEQTFNEAAQSLPMRWRYYCIQDTLCFPSKAKELWDIPKHLIILYTEWIKHPGIWPGVNMGIFVHLKCVITYIY